MTVVSYLATAAVVLAVIWAVVRLARISVRSPALAAVAVVAVFALIAITPLCGTMFNCGCAWPWDGLYHHCNVFNADAKLKCHWCDSRAAGALSMIAVFAASGLVTYRISATSERASANAASPSACSRAR